MFSEIENIKDKFKELQEENRILKSQINSLKIEKTRLRESKETLRIILEEVVPAFVFLDFKGNILNANIKATELSGYSKEEFFQKNIDEIALEINPMKHRQNYWEKLELGKKVKVYGMHKRKDGSIYPAETMLVRINFNGKPVIAAFARDISKSKEAEEKANISEEMYRIISKNANDLIFIMTIDGKFLYCNEAFNRVLGYDPEELIGSFGIELIHSEHIHKAYQNLEKMKYTQLLKNEYRVRCKDGSYKWIESTGGGIYNKQNKLIKIIGISRDVTDRKEAEQLIQQENKKLTELDKMREELINRISHELKTPLIPLLCGSELINTIFKNQMGEEAKETIKIIHQSALRLKFLIDNILDASIIEHNHFNISKKKENLVELIHDSIDKLSYFTKNRQLKINVPPSEPIYFNVDKIRVTQIVINLISNAIKNTPIGGEIYITSEDHQDYIDIEIKDTGIGLTENELKKLFTKFGKIERYGKGLDVNIEGSGLGLYISKYFAELHNGDILVESEGRNKGAKFTLRFFKS